MGPVVLDTSVVVAAIDPADAHHRDAAAEITALRGNRELRISTISIAELNSIKGPNRRARLERIARFVDALGADSVVGIDRQTAELAGGARAQRPSLRLPDALIKATADRIGGELLTADRRLAKLDGVSLLGTHR